MGSVFSALQQRWALCPGGIMYTNRSGLWEAASATQWLKQCEDSNVKVLQRFECNSVLGHLRPADVDEFAIAMLKMTLSEEMIAAWID
jgi:hypothetical protein